MTVDCPSCGAPASVHVAGELAAALGDTTLRLLGVPVARCAAGHLLPWPDDLADRVEARTEELLLRASRRRLRRQEACGDCGVELTMPPRHTDTPVSLLVEDHVVTAVLECRMVRCPGCGAEQLPTDVGGHLGQVVEAALDRVATPG